MLVKRPRNPADLSVSSKGSIESCQAFKVQHKNSANPAIQTIQLNMVGKTRQSTSPIRQAPKPAVKLTQSNQKIKALVSPKTTTIQQQKLFMLKPNSLPTTTTSGGMKPARQSTGILQPKPLSSTVMFNKLKKNKPILNKEASKTQTSGFLSQQKDSLTLAAAP